MSKTTVKWNKNINYQINGKGILNSNKKWKVKSSITGFEHASFSGAVQYRNSVTLYPLGHSAHERDLMWNIERVKVNPTWT